MNFVWANARGSAKSIAASTNAQEWLLEAHCGIGQCAGEADSRRNAYQNKIAWELKRNVVGIRGRVREFSTGGDYDDGAQEQ